MSYAALHFAKHYRKAKVVNYTNKNFNLIRLIAYLLCDLITVLLKQLKCGRELPIDATSCRSMGFYSLAFEAKLLLFSQLHQQTSIARRLSFY